MSLFVTDNYMTEAGDVPPAEELGDRIAQFHVTASPRAVRGRFVRTFGATSGSGVLRKVESVKVDPTHGRVLVADETMRNLKVYTPSGRYSGVTVGDGLFQNEPEGIGLFTCGDGGYWIVADQHPKDNVFRVFERRTLEPAGSFSGEQTRNTDGVAVVSGGAGGGAVYAVHDGRAVVAFPWEDVARALDLRCR